MPPVNHRFLFWAPRILCISFALFLSLFAMDVFQEGYSLGQTMLTLLIHLIPVYMVVAALVVAWKWEWVGAILFFGLGVFYIVITAGEAHIGAYLGISGPLFVVGVLFLLGWLRKDRGVGAA